MNISPTALAKLDANRVYQALSERAHTTFGRELALALRPVLTRSEIELAWRRIAEAVEGPTLSLGGVADIRPLITRVQDGEMLDGKEILNFAYTLDAAGTIKRAILQSERPALGALAQEIYSFDASLRLVREQLDKDGNVRDDATPKLREIRRRLNPLRGRIRERLQTILNRHSADVQDPIVTLRRDRYVIPVKANAQSRVPGIVIDTSDSGATVFLEPSNVVPLNNELTLLHLEERDEVRRILIALAQRLAYEEGLEQTLEALGQLDLIAASARLAKDWRLALPQFSDTGELKLVKARHPLIENCVPNSIELTPSQRLLIITGPNAGGKTVLLKTLGLAVVMANSGLFVAADAKKSPTLPLLEAVLTDIGDEQSIEASLSTYAGHLTNLKRIVEQANDKVLVLIDELGSGTDPSEGAAISQAVVERVLASGARGLINTHLGPLKVFASDTAGVINAAMQFDIEALRPKFTLVLGQPGRSYALAIAERLGLTAELLARADTLLGSEATELEGLLETLEQQRESLQAQLTEAEGARAEAVGEAKILRKQIAILRKQEQQVIAQAAEKADEMLQSTLKQATELRRTAHTDKEQRAQAIEELHELRREVKRQAGITPPQPSKKKRTQAAPSQSRYAPGTEVYVKEYDASGPVVEVRGDELVVQLGLLKVTVPKKQVDIKQTAAQKAEKKIQSTAAFAAPTRFEREINLRGERVEPALEKIRDFILEARSLKVSSVRILHGKGTGALRDAVRNYLKNDKFVEKFEDAVPYEGGHGVTVAYLRF